MKTLKGTIAVMALMAMTLASATAQNNNAPANPAPPPGNAPEPSPAPAPAQAQPSAQPNGAQQPAAPTAPKIVSIIALATRSCVAYWIPRSMTVAPFATPLIGNTFR